MTTFQYIEDYIEVMAGLREITANGLSPGPINLFGAAGSAPISLARYDVNIVNSMAQQTAGGTGLTDRQGDLALRLVSKYQRQFSSKGVDVAPSVAKPTFRNPLRIIDRSKTVYVDDNVLVLKFPYDNILVPKITTAAKLSEGKFSFDRDAKLWKLALTEHNVNFAYTFGRENGFNISEEVQSYMDLIIGCENQDYKIELNAVDGIVTITNAEASLYKYIEDQIGSLTVENLIRLVDYAPVLGYTVHSDVVQCVQYEFTPIVSGLMLNKESHVGRRDQYESGEYLVEDLVKYAEITQRWPIHIYEPDVSFKLRDTIRRYIQEDELLDMSTRQSTAQVDLTGIKCVYFTKLKRSWPHRIPILVSTNAMLHGAEKQAMLFAAEKVVYYTPTTLNREAKTIAGQVTDQG